jgi:hypothetical protein
MNRQSKEALNPKIIQHRIQGMATRSILINQGVTNMGGRISISTANGASSDAPAIFTFRLLIKVSSFRLSGLNEGLNINK